MDRMNPLDASFLYLEDGTTHMHIASCAVFEGPPPDFREIVELFASKLPLVPRYRQRVRFVPFDLGRPVWVDDPDFDIEYHVRHTALPPPGDERDLERLMGRLMSQELDRSRPLWETWVVEGLEADRWAIVGKVHHCMVDGVAGVDLIALVLDSTPTPSVAVDDGWDPEPMPSPVRLTVDAVTDILRSPREQLRAVRSAVMAPRHALRHAGDVVAGLRSFGSALRPTPHTSLDGSIGPHRRWTCARASLDDVRAIRGALGGTVNDVVLAAITRGFRDLIESRGEDPATVGLRTLVPVSVRSESARGVFDNRVSAILFDLPVHVAEPLDRLTAVRDEMSRLKVSHEPEAGEALTSLIGAFPPALTAQSTRLAVRVLTRVQQRSMNTVTTNVPGPPMPLYAAGREMLEYLPFVPLGPGVRIGVAILSYNGRLAFGVTGDFETAPDIGVVAGGIETEISDLVSLAGASTARRARGRSEATVRPSGPVRRDRGAVPSQSSPQMQRRR
jgi:diacylglycerol O-acyltransferase